MRLAGSRATIAALTLAAALALAACEEEDGPSSPSPSDTPSVPESSSPTDPTTTATEAGPVEPTLPVEAEAKSRAGAEAFVRFYWDVVNYATETGDVRLLMQLDQPSCMGCAGGIDLIEAVYSSGGHFVGGRYRVLRLEPAQSPSGDWAITTYTKVGEQRVVGAGALNETYPGGRGKWLIAIARVKNSWSVTTLEGL